MAFCNSCGTTLSEGTKFCSKCGAAISGNPSGMATARPPQPPMPAPPPSSGSSSALKIILIIVGVIILIGVLGIATIGFIGYRVAKSAKISQNGENVKIDSPFGNISANDPDQAIKELGVDVYPGAQVQKQGTASVTIFGIHSVTANFVSSDSVDKVCDFYKTKFPNASVQSSASTSCTIVAGAQENSTTINAQSSGDGCKFQIVTVNKKPSS